MRIHDLTLTLTHTLRPGTATWPGEDGPALTKVRRIAKGDAANVARR